MRLAEADAAVQEQRVVGVTRTLATLSAAAWASRLAEPTMKLLNVYRLFRLSAPPAEAGGMATCESSSTCSGTGPDASATTNSTWTEPPTTRARVWLISGR